MRYGIAIGIAMAVLEAYAGMHFSHCHVHPMRQDERFHFMEAEGHQWVMYHCEPGIWLAMVMSSSSCSAEHVLLL